MEWVNLAVLVAAIVALSFKRSLQTKAINETKKNYAELSEKVETLATDIVEIKKDIEQIKESLERSR